ncbi:Glycosylphosphatidylinositol:protein transamidase, GAA1 component [Xylona heveae TC161]|uniref:Glycosylphosphatidylinositol:protein transamidase, GAA1 component n=1 Tax=Xylona heveae (strain CBS 132557 / TC161) TaxID=1328760 RepID=A0A164ZBP2_XYLHT|nr:Glycosylphosphatidylinositol:protein transamidase, GAA1 component [Xylona heveae TC161]KZF18904.1 Glycosylphosphatidylinositol:protein transamidase, GAA1 component [Xylona heveae TC161]
MALISAGLMLQHHRRILAVPPYLSIFCIVVGVIWLFLLPLNDYSRQTYISENALLPGQVHTYFGGSEHHIFKAYRAEVEAMTREDNDLIPQKISGIFESTGLKAARQEYRYTFSGKNTSGENVYSILPAPRGDATEAIVLVGAWKSLDGRVNVNGVALVLTLARYFRRWSLWSKDIIFLVAADSTAGPQAWADAYHDAHSTVSAASLSLKSGALQGVIALDYAQPYRFDSLHVIYDGINGQLPNLDLFNTVVSIASGQMGIKTTLQQMWKHDDNYKSRLQTMLRGMLNQGLGHASGPHSGFIPYHVDAVTLHAVGEGWHDEMAMGRTVESIFRSLNNLLEHFHQSFFFYLLMQPNRFVSIGTYLPSAMLVAISFTIMAIALWIQSGRTSCASDKCNLIKDRPEGVEFVKQDTMLALVPNSSIVVPKRRLFLPLLFVGAVHFLGFAPLFVFNHSSQSSLLLAFAILCGFNLIAPQCIATALKRLFLPKESQILMIKSFSLLFVGMCLSALATLNFSLSLLIGLLATPLAFIGPGIISTPAKLISCLILYAFSPSTIVLFAGRYWNYRLENILEKASFGWNIWGMWTQVVFWCLWWPAWLISAVLWHC